MRGLGRSGGWVLGLLAVLGLFTVAAAVWRAEKLIPLIPRLQSDDYLQKKLNLPQWVRLDGVAPLAVSAILTSEDDAFYQNRGYELSSMWDAFKEDLRSLRFKRGASTITQQVMKNTLLNKRKTLSRKIEELILAQAAEKALSKDRILEIYLNTAQWGDKLYGIEEASQFYFQVPARDLTLEEGVYLAALLPSPVRYSRSFKKGQVSTRDQKVMDSILARMLALDLISSDQFEKAEAALLPFEAAPDLSPTPTPTP
ncbi:MAG TPA: biosynthetic peptidoglycan transglycosylase [bacterium]|nr:biosynthetic peptidoglycan transglycosylase [bacterium]